MKRTIKAVKKEEVKSFEYFNPNPTVKYKKSGEAYRWHKPDCVIRAFCGATGMTWQDGYDFLCHIGREMFDVPNSRDVFAEAMKRQGFKYVAMPKIKSGDTRLTVKELAALKKDTTCVFSVANHEVCAKEGKYWDTWDCGYKSVYSYWEK